LPELPKLPKIAQIEKQNCNADNADNADNTDQEKGTLLKASLDLLKKYSTDALTRTEV
jgi:hypothetical protein